VSYFHQLVADKSYSNFCGKKNAFEV
jgi:hypothetical protein